MHVIRATPRHARAIEATADLLRKLRIEAMFVGGVARAVWLGGEFSSGSIDVLGLMTAQQKNQLAMMASNRGFRVEREEIEATEELDLVPLNFVDEGGEVRVHVLLATNALYGRMFANAVEVDEASSRRVDEDQRDQPGAEPRRLDDSTTRPLVRVPSAEDLALLLQMSGDEDGVRKLTMLPDFDRHRYNERLVSIGLGAEVVAE
jgi:hypothetical protein